MFPAKNRGNRNLLNYNLRHVHFGIRQKSGVTIVPAKQRKWENTPNTTTCNTPKQKSQGKVVPVHDGGERSHHAPADLSPENNPGTF
jgi:hypothetical protein